MILAHNSSVTMHCNLLTDIRIARETGYGGMEIWHTKLYRYLDQGFSVADLREHLGCIKIVGVGYVQDVERQAPDARAALLDECERMCSVAAELGCDQVEVLTGPRYPLTDGRNAGYRGLADLPWPEIRRLTARNIAGLADIAARHGLRIYVEPLAWTAVNTIERVLEVIDSAGRDNVGYVFDFWHQWASGMTLEQIAKLDASLIAGVHFCDSLPGPSHGPWTLAQRAVWTGDGEVPLKEWTDAVLATGFSGWWAAELISPMHWELDPRQTAQRLRELMESHIGAGSQTMPTTGGDKCLTPQV